MSFRYWFQILRKSAAQGDEIGNPEAKLIEYFEKNDGTEEGFEGEERYNFRDAASK